MKNRKKSFKKRKPLKTIIIIFLSLIAIVGIYALTADLIVVNSTKGDIISQEKAKELKDVDCIIVLGCKVYDDGKPCPLLSDRLERGTELYNQGVSKKLLMSGDHGKTDYNEVFTMKKYATDKGINSGDVFMDHAGFSTYETMYRAKDIFKAKKVVIVTQNYHLYRALYIAKALGLEAYGVSSDYNVYSGQNFREVREILARDKDFVTSIFKPEPTYLGEAIPVSGNGNATNDY